MRANTGTPGLRSGLVWGKGRKVPGGTQLVQPLPIGQVTHTGWRPGRNSAPNLFADLGMTLPWCPHQGPEGPQTDDAASSCRSTHSPFPPRQVAPR